MVKAGNIHKFQISISSFIIEFSTKKRGMNANLCKTCLVSALKPKFNCNCHFAMCRFDLVKEFPLRILLTFFLPNPVCTICKHIDIHLYAMHTAQCTHCYTARYTSKFLGNMVFPFIAIQLSILSSVYFIQIIDL